MMYLVEERCPIPTLKFLLTSTFTLPCFVLLFSDYPIFFLFLLLSFFIGFEIWNTLLSRRVVNTLWSIYIQGPFIWREQKTWANGYAFDFWKLPFNPQLLGWTSSVFPVLVMDYVHLAMDHAWPHLTNSAHILKASLIFESHVQRINWHKDWVHNLGLIKFYQWVDCLQIKPRG